MVTVSGEGEMSSISSLKLSATAAGGPARTGGATCGGAGAAGPEASWSSRIFFQGRLSKCDMASIEMPTFSSANGSRFLILRESLTCSFGVTMRASLN